MYNPCQCNHCLEQTNLAQSNLSHSDVTSSNSTKDKKTKNIDDFKKKISFFQSISQKSFKNKQNLPKNSKNNQKMANYRLTLTDVGTEDGYFVEMYKDLSAFEYAMILSEIFGIDVDVDYDEDNDITLEQSDNHFGPNIKMFNNFDELFDYLSEQKNKYRKDQEEQ